MRHYLEERGWDTTGITIHELLFITAAITLRIVDVGLVQSLAWDLFINGG